MSLGHVIASINHDIGGPAYSVPALLNTLEQYHYKPHLFTLDYFAHGQMHELGKVKLHSYHTDALIRFTRGFHLGLRSDLLRLARDELSIIHSHGLWMYPNKAARVAANKYNLPFVVSPRGMLEPWSREKSRWRKKIAWQMYERKNIESATVLHVTAEPEAKSLREFGIEQPIAVIPNGVSLPPKEKIPDRSYANKFSPRFADKKWVLFLSRIDPKKGTDALIRVWKNLYEEYPDHLLIIAGPDLIGWRKELERDVFKSNMSHSVLFTGSVQSDFKACLLAHSEFFVLPTHSENFGNVIPEALSYGTPVITTHGAPWEVLREVDAGWWIENTEAELEKTMREALSSHAMTLDQKGQSGRKLVEERFSWEKIAEDFDKLYRWLLTHKEKPSFILDGE